MLIIYTTETCARCKIVEDFLNQNGIEYEEKDLVEYKKEVENSEQFKNGLYPVIYDKESEQFISIQDVLNRKV